MFEAVLILLLSIGVYYYTGNIFYAEIFCRFSTDKLSSPDISLTIWLIGSCSWDSKVTLFRRRVSAIEKLNGCFCVVTGDLTDDPKDVFCMFCFNKFWALDFNASWIFYRFFLLVVKSSHISFDFFNIKSYDYFLFLSQHG